MSKLSEWERKAKIRKGEPMTLQFGEQSLTFYPVTMAHYEEFLEVKTAWAIRLASLPVQYLAMPFISALWAVDVDMAMQSHTATGLFDRAIRLLYLTLRLEYKREEAYKKIFCQSDNLRNLSYVEVTQTDGETVKLTPQDISDRIRPLIAEQNGIDLPDENANNELIAEEQRISNENAAKLKISTDTLISSVAYLSQLSESELDGWTVLRFERRVKAIERNKNYTLYRQAELSGMVKFEKGNPCPSWCYDKEEGLSAAVRTMDELQERVSGIGNVSQTVEQANQKNLKGDNSNGL